MKKWTKENWKDFASAIGIRAIRTIAQTAIAMIGTNMFLEEVNWIATGSAIVLAGILSILNSVITGLPEVQNE